jgi:hypothetical protein
MSQYGALRLAGLGVGYDSILGHFYGGLRPVAAPDLLPARVDVGLAWERDEVRLTIPGPFRLIADGITLFTAPAGEWHFIHTREGLVGVVPPVRFLLDLLQRLTLDLPFL